jgi:hypothetical protein
MNSTVKRRGILIVGWLSALAGYVFGLFLIRGIFLGITQGFHARGSQALWIVLSYLLCFAFAAYLISIGRRTISFGKGVPRPKGRFGWGRILTGIIILWSNIVSRFDLIPVRFKPLQASNDVEAVAMSITEVLLFVGCVLLIFWGIWRGLRRQPPALSDIKTTY